MEATSPETTPTSEASIVTDRAVRYGKQLVSHLSRRSGGEWDAEKGAGWIQLGEQGRADVQALGDSLTLQVCGPDLETLERLEGVVGSHLVRFGAKDEFTVDWKRGDGTDGTTQSAGDGESAGEERP